MRYRQRAETIRERYRADVEKVRGNRDLSDEGRRRQLALLFTRTRNELREQAEKEREVLERRSSELERKLFAGGDQLWQDPVSKRDAATRAAQLKTSDEALRLLGQAELTSDGDLARAIGRQSVQRMSTGVREVDAPWEDVFRAFMAPRAHLSPIVEELAEIENLQAPQVFSPFGVSRPTGITEVDVNAALSGKEPEPAPRQTSGPLRDPSKVMTTAADRADWQAATGGQTA